MKRELDRWRERIDVPRFIEDDPVQFPRRYAGRDDIEMAAFLTAVIAWGRRDLIIRSAEKMFALMEPGPRAFVMGGGHEKLKDRRSIHRTFFEGDLRYFCRGFKACYEKYGCLEALFSRALDNGGDIWEGIGLFREEMAGANGGVYTKHIAFPGTSACKRINLALRWLARREGSVDMGLWKSVDPAALVIPLDTHVAGAARRLGLLRRKSNDRKAAVELTERLRVFCPEDPVKYDFALFGMGLEERAAFRRSPKPL